MASKTRSIARNMAHAQMAAEGIQHPNKVLAKGFFEGKQKLDRKTRTRDSRFAFAWRDYFAARVAAASLAGQQRSKRKGAAK